jgi:hypothetical protein
MRNVSKPLAQSARSDPIIIKPRQTSVVEAEGSIRKGAFAHNARVPDGKEDETDNRKCEVKGGDLSASENEIGEDRFDNAQSETCVSNPNEQPFGFLSSLGPFLPLRPIVVACCHAVTA